MYAKVKKMMTVIVIAAYIVSICRVSGLKL